MLSPLRNPVYRRLFLAQAVALVGTGLATVALALLAHRLAGAAAGAVLGTALAIKMAAYVGVAPLAAALAERLPRRAWLVGLDLMRAALVLALPLVDAIWQVYVLIFLLQSASAAFTPAFQATIPELLPDERDYTRALSLSRLAYDLESLLSPLLAGALLTVLGFHWLFAGTALGFVASATLVLSVALPAPGAVAPALPFGRRLTRGLRGYLATPRLRGLLAVSLAAAAGGAMVFVNTVVIVRSGLGRPAADVAVALAAFGGGSMLAALALPRLLDRLPERRVMLAGAALMAATLFLAGTGAPTWTALLAAWLALGLGYGAALTPGGRLLRRSAAGADLPALFAAQFALSHLAWLAAYPLAGWLGAAAGMGAAFLALGALAAAATAAAATVWPAHDPEVLAHRHDDLPPGHPHLQGAEGFLHAHPFVIDAEHRRWPA